MAKWSRYDIKMRNFELRRNWYAKFESLVVDAAEKHRGKIEWQTAIFFYESGMSAEDAAKKYVETRK